MSEVVNNMEKHRYEIEVDGHVAATYYRFLDGVIVFTHTQVPPELEGKGIGSELVKGALDQVRADRFRARAQCPFVKDWLEKHPDYDDLLRPNL
ncbi:acetyltransferase [Nitrobacter hamburgensis X14]|uniref:Acetyltransferase n=1 Tax=Nitrobacter hamburgensis (strain DSM 10229 / NCIMB 13809 / X14) TaxID=323097 RepID=Q1QMC5_NITHX|nr:GNAT family N-acetyltransferase [Nitrobacter hamburgensis]ABE62622.1 acetyltransferase [Nitrobacter hamburgensis X14]